MNLEALHPNERLALNLFARGEAHEAGLFSTFFTEPAIYQFGNFPTAFDRAAIAASGAAFFAQITAVYHDIKTLHALDDELVLVEMDVHYWTPDGRHTVLPCADLFRVAGSLFSELRIFMDVNPVFEAKTVVGAEVSVFTRPDGGRIPPEGVMPAFYTEHPDGQAWIAAGHRPRWSIDGPKWPLSGGEPATPARASA